MTIFLQRNYPQKMGSSTYTIARYGCLLTSITMIYDYFFKALSTPPEIDQKLSFDANGYLFWSSLSNIGLKLSQRIVGLQDGVIKEALANPNECCVLQVNSSHWVWCIGGKLPILGYRIADPWFGDKSYTSRYKNNITGIAVISKV